MLSPKKIISLPVADKSYAGNILFRFETEFAALGRC
jgi:hypothetical protein